MNKVRPHNEKGIEGTMLYEKFKESKIMVLEQQPVIINSQLF